MARGIGIWLFGDY